MNRVWAIVFFPHGGRPRVVPVSLHDYAPLSEVLQGVAQFVRLPVERLLLSIEKQHRLVSQVDLSTPLATMVELPKLSIRIFERPASSSLKRVQFCHCILRRHPPPGQTRWAADGVPAWMWLPEAELEHYPVSKLKDLANDLVKRVAPESSRDRFTLSLLNAQGDEFVEDSLEPSLDKYFENFVTVDLRKNIAVCLLWNSHQPPTPCSPYEDAAFRTVKPQWCPGIERKSVQDHALAPGVMIDVRLDDGVWTEGTVSACEWPFVQIRLFNSRGSPPFWLDLLREPDRISRFRTFPLAEVLRRCPAREDIRPLRSDRQIMVYESGRWKPAVVHACGWHSVLLKPPPGSTQTERILYESYPTAGGYFATTTKPPSPEYMLWPSFDRVGSLDNGHRVRFEQLLQPRLARLIGRAALLAARFVGAARNDLQELRLGWPVMMPAPSIAGIWEEYEMMEFDPQTERLVLKRAVGVGSRLQLPFDSLLLVPYGSSQGQMQERLQKIVWGDVMWEK